MAVLQTHDYGMATVDGAVPEHVVSHHGATQGDLVRRLRHMRSTLGYVLYLPDKIPPVAHTLQPLDQVIDPLHFILWSLILPKAQVVQLGEALAGRAGMYHVRRRVPGDATLSAQLLPKVGRIYIALNELHSRRGTTSVTAGEHHGISIVPAGEVGVNVKPNALGPGRSGAAGEATLPAV
jgi:hypothetical protein